MTCATLNCYEVRNETRREGESVPSCQAAVEERHSLVVNSGSRSSFHANSRQVPDVRDSRSCERTESRARGEEQRRERRQVAASAWHSRANRGTQGGELGQVDASQGGIPPLAL